MPATNYPLLAVWGLTFGSWLILWSLLGVLTLLLIVLLHTRWSSARPWRKCAVLSLWVHLLLAFAATTIRIVTGAPEQGDETPIRVTVMPASIESEQPKEEEITPDRELPTDPQLIAPETDPLEPPVLEPLEAPALEPLAAEPEQEAVVAEKQPPPSPALGEEMTSEVSEPAPESVGESVASTPEQQAELAKAADAASPAPPLPEKPKVPEAYRDRFAEDRSEIVEQRGGSAQTERAVQNALGWLAKSQSENGGWDASKFSAGEERRVLGENRQQAGINADTGVSGLALLAFLGAGHTHLRGPYATDVARGLEYLRQAQRSDGSLYGDAQMFARTYCHSMATFAVCEAWALTEDERLEPMARSAIRYTLSLQHPADGGWRYLRGHTGDTSQLGWVLMTLKSARLAGIGIPAVTWTRVDRFLRRVERGSGGGLAAYRPEGPPSRTMTAEAMFCRQLRHEIEATELAPTIAREATHSILQELPSKAHRNFYFWYYASLALQQNQHQSPEAAEAWENWNHALTTTLLTTQQDDGSWQPDTVWGGYGGRVYTTALATLCLEVYYRYNPVEATREIAGRKGWQGVRK
ncbi:MAG: squalene--hopene cyclase [Pirellulales bacterium]|nr:squalene--hopene cyclase [Pirellulales bacterium]